MNPTQRFGMWTLFALLVLALALGGCTAAATVTQDEANSAEAQQLAQQLNTTLAAEGLSAPPVAILAALYGTDGGASCAALQDGGSQAILGLTFNGDASGRRRAGVSQEVLAYDQAVIQTYCPAMLTIFQGLVADQGLAVPDITYPVAAPEATPEATPSS